MRPRCRGSSARGRNRPHSVKRWENVTVLVVADTCTAQPVAQLSPEWPGQRTRARTWRSLSTKKFYFHKTPHSPSVNTGNSYQVWRELSHGRPPGLVYSIENTQHIKKKHINHPFPYVFLAYLCITNYQISLAIVKMLLLKCIIIWVKHLIWVKATFTQMGMPFG